MPEVSLIVPCYNSEKTIDKCLTSLKNQSFKNIEIIVVDDGSTDKSKKKIDKYIKNDKRIFYYYKKNGGLSDARNYGLKKAKGNYVCFIDSDDYVSEFYVQKMYEAIKKSGSQIAICGFSRIYAKKITTEKITNDTVDMCIRPAAWNKMFERNIFIDNKIFFPKGKWYEDLGTTPKITLNTKYSIVKDNLYYYVQNPKSIMHTYDDRIFDIYEILEGIEKYAKDNKFYDNKKASIEFMHIYHILIGTTYRSSFTKNFSKDLIKDIYSKVYHKYPDWYKNHYIRKMGIAYKLYLYLLHKKSFGLIYYLLKIFGRFLYI